MNVMYRNKGFTLVELLIVITILAIMTVIMVGILNPIALVNKAHDAQRKKDLRTIKIAMEAYFGDKGCYPSDIPPANLLSGLNNVSNCGGNIFSPWLDSWPCDPNKRVPYILTTDGTACPHWYKIFTNLDNKTDKDIPAGWYSVASGFGVGDGTLSSNVVNYGTSSTNVNWFDKTFNVACVVAAGSQCYTIIDTVWKPIDSHHVDGTPWYRRKNDDPTSDAAGVFTKMDGGCEVDCCFNGGPCP